jgi:hypothetical protein
MRDDGVPVFVENDTDMRRLRRPCAEIIQGGRGVDHDSGLRGKESVLHADMDDVIARLNLKRIC